MLERPETNPELQALVMAAIRATPAKPQPTREDVAQEEARRDSMMPFAYRQPQPKTREEAVVMLDKVRDLLRYDPATGILRYRHQESPGAPGDWRSLATVPGRNGYAMTKLYGMTLYSAQVVWLLHHGRFPHGRLKRHDGDTLNDRIENLYEPRSEPVVPRTGPRQRLNASRGVARCGANHWQAYVRVGGRQINLGRFKTEPEAIAARAAWDRGDDLV